MASKDESKEKKKTPDHVLDYYRKFSQNKNLPKYFSGSSVSYMPEIVTEAKEQKSFKVTVDFFDADENEVKTISRASSAMSNKKLEWDNGADIGYSNAELHKTASLPDIKIAVSDSEANKDTSNEQENVKVVVIKYSDESDSSDIPVEINIQSSSSDEQKNDNIKSKIGLPYAHSTPKHEVEPHIKETPVIKREPKPKIINLCITKPVLLECEPKSVKSLHKLIQATAKFTSIAIQTDKLEKNEIIINTAQTETPNNQGLELIEAQDDSPTQKKSSSSQTNSAVVSNCESFEYVKQDDSKLKRHKTKPDLSKVHGESSSVQETSKECPLGKIISANQAEIVPDELQKYVELLQKLVKSKKYDAATKKRYIKKIMGKIIDLNCREESASTSSELFYPKKNKEQFVPPQPKIQSSTESSDPKQGNSLQNNIPWYPAHQAKHSPKKTNPEPQPYIDPKPPSSTNTDGGEKPSSKESTSQPEIIPIQTKPKNKKFSRFTLTNNELYINHDSLAPENSNFGTTSGFVPIRTSDNTTSSSGKSYQNWKDDKTTSERLLEQKLMGNQGNLLTEYVNQERENQLNWINNEISHLKKLKHLLEAPASNDLGDIITGRQTHVYSVSKKSDSDLKRKYVIQTEIGSTEIGEIDFQLDGQVFNVHDGYSSRPNSGRLRGDIEVISNNSTTNIRVSTSCQNCGRRNCICQICVKCRNNPCRCCPYCRKVYCNCKNCYKCQQSPCSCCQTCRKPVCICNSCPKCRKSVCVCLNLESLQDSSGNDDGKAKCKCSPRLYLCTQCGNFSSNLDCGCGKKSDVTSDEELRQLGSARGSLNINHDLGLSPRSKSNTTSGEKIYLGSPLQSSRPSQMQTANIFYGCKDSQTEEENATEKIQTDYIPVQTATTQTTYRCPNSPTKSNLNRLNDRSKTVQTAYIPMEDALTQTSLRSNLDTGRSSKTAIKSDITEAIQTDYIPIRSAETQTSKRQSKSSDESANTSNDIQQNLEEESFQSQSSQSSDKPRKSSTSTSSICLCCKKTISDRAARLSQKINRDNLCLCHQCLRKNPTSQDIRDNQKCCCFSLVKTDMLRQLKKTITELHDTFCTCASPNRQLNSNYCCHCRRRLRDTTQTKNGIAYTLTLVNKSKNKRTPKKRSRNLEEIKIKVDSSSNGKSSKDKENKSRKDTNCDLDRKKSTDRSSYTLQEYLCQNKPDFVNSADHRRQVVLNNKIERERNSEELKLRYLSERQFPIKKNRLFTEKEMKDLTRRHYQQLPEVKNKIVEQKRQQLHRASRLLVDTFNKKIQKNTLKGRNNFPLDVNVVNLV